MRFLRNIFGKVGGWLGRPFAFLSAAWNRMAPRERRLISILSGVFVLFCVLVTGYLIWDWRSDITEANEKMREALALIAKEGDAYRDAKSRVSSVEARIGVEAPQLAGDLEAAAKEAGFQIPETVERPTAPAGKHYLEHSLEVKLRKVDLKSLATFLNKVETGRRLILITRMQIRRSFGDADKLDVELTAAAYERVKEDKRKKPTPAKGKGEG